MTDYVFVEGTDTITDIIVYQGVTTADGAADGSTVVCTDITANADWDGNLIVITSGDYQGQTRDINGDTSAGTITSASVFGGKILEGVTFSIVGIRTVPAELAAFETWVKTAIGDSSAHNLISLVAKWGDITRSLDLLLGARWDLAGDLGTDIVNIINAISAIQNNTRFTAAVPVQMCKPDAGNEAFRMASNLYDTEGNMEDPTNSEILVRIIKDDGTYITDTYKENGLSNLLDNATDSTTFPSASGWRAMEREAAGKFYFFYKLAHDATEESLIVEFGWTESTKDNYQSRSTEIADVHGDLATLLDYVDYEGATSLADKLTVARAGYLDILDSDSKYILSTAVTAPSVNSLTKFIASGGTALGTTLAASKSLIDAIGHTGSALVASGIGMELRRGTGTQIPDNKGIYDYLQYLTGNAYTRVGAPVGASISIDIAAIKSEIDNGTYGLSAQNAYHWNKDISAYTGAKAGTYLKSLYDDWLNGGRLDLILDTINDDTKLQFVAAGSKTIASAAEKYLSIDSGTDGAEIVSLTIKGVTGADWTIETYIPADDAVTTPAAGDKRDEDVYVNTNDKGGQLTNIGAIRYNMFLDITNDSGVSDDIDEVIIAYRSAGTLSLAWEA